MMSLASDISLDLSVWILSTCSWQTQKCHGNHSLLYEVICYGILQLGREEGNVESSFTEFLEAPADDSQHPSNVPDSSFMKTAPFSQALHDPSFI